MSKLSYLISLSVTDLELIFHTLTSATRSRSPSYVHQPYFLPETRGETSSHFTLSCLISWHHYCHSSWLSSVTAKLLLVGFSARPAILARYICWQPALFPSRDTYCHSSWLSTLITKTLLVTMSFVFFITKRFALEIFLSDVRQRSERNQVNDELAI